MGAGTGTKKNLSRLMVILAAFIFILSCVRLAASAAGPSSLLSAVLTTDKESYDEGEDIGIALRVTNTNGYTVDKINSEISLPKELLLKEGELKEGPFSLEAGEDRTNVVTAYTIKAIDTSGNEEEPAMPTGNISLLIWAVLAVLSGGFVIISLIRAKHAQKALALFLCAGILLTSVPVDAFAEEIKDNLFGSITVSKEIAVGGVKKTISARVTYNDNSRNDDDKDKTKDEVTVTFDAGDGTPVEPITVKKGETIDRLPQSFGVGKAFMGWYTDTALTNEFFTDTPVNEDITVFASFIDSADDFELGEETTFYEEDCTENHPITLICDEEITADNLESFITISAFTGSVPEDFVVTSNGDREYTIIPKTPYSKGCMYRVTAREGVSFKGLAETVFQYTFKIYKEESNIVELRDNIKYLDRAKLTETANELEYIVPSDYFNANSLAKDDVICVGDGTKNVTDDSLFVKIVDIAQNGDCYYIQTVDCEVEDVFEKVDIYFTEAAQNKYLEDGLDTQALEEQVLNSEGVQQLNLVLASVLVESQTVKEELGGESLLGVAAYSLADDRMKDFSDYANPKGETLVDLAKKLGHGLTVSVKIGEAENRNFTVPDPDYWTAITFTLNYKNTIKNKLKVDATFKITEYLNVSLQGYKEFEFKWFELPELEFNYAANIYTQTDLELQVLVCSVGANSYRNITDEVTRMLGSDEENDTEGLVNDVKKMLNSKGGYIELCRLPFFTTVKPLSLFQLNFELDFVVKVSFAGGIGSKFSVLESRQVGAFGNSKDHKFEMYNNKLLEGDRYSFDLTVCGYTGIKMGVAGQLTVSFTGLRRLGEVGVEVQVGAYLDIYGYARYHVVKPDHRFPDVFRTLMGGFYLEGGIYLEVNLVAESKVFNLRAEAPLIPELKWPLFSMGDKKLVVCLNDQPTPIIITSSDSTYCETSVSTFPAVSAQVIDITTGAIDKNATIPWNRVSINPSGKGFRMVSTYDGWKLVYDQPYSSRGKGSDECTAQIHYYGNSLQFTKTADTKVSTTKTVKIIWYDEKRVDYENIGKIYNVNFYREADGEKTLLCTRKVKAGDYAGDLRVADMPDSWKYVGGEWNNHPYFTPVTQDNMEFIYKTNKAQVFVEFTYFDVTTRKWTAEIRAVNLGDMPAIPDNFENEYIKLKNWSGMYGVYYRQSEYAGDAVKVMDLNVYDHFIKSGYPTDRAIYKVTGDTADMDLCRQYREEYFDVICFYRAVYSRENMTVTYNFLDYTGAKTSHSISVPYGKAPTTRYYACPLGYTFAGYTSDGGKTVYGHYDELPKVYEDIVYEAVYEKNVYNIDIQYYDDVTCEYKTYRKLQVDGAETIPQSVFDEALQACKWQEGTKYKLHNWGEIQNGVYAHTFYPDSTQVYRDMVLRPIFERDVAISLDAGAGRLLFEDTFDAYGYQDYEVTVSQWAVRDSDDYNDYETVGWKNDTTGEIYRIGEKVKIDTATKLTAVYEAIPKTYTVNVYTSHGLLLNGESEDTFTGGYDGYLEFVEKYNSFTPADVKEEGCTYEFIGMTTSTFDNGLTLIMSFDRWNKNIHRHTIKLDANGGSLLGYDELTEDYGTEITLSDMAVCSKSDELRSYIFAGWQDEDGNVYQKDAVITLKKDMTLKAVWLDGDYKEYNVTFILDGAVIREETYHYGDVLPAFSAPAEADGYIFGGWSWLGAEGELDNQPQTMPAFALTAYGTTAKCGITYMLDGEVYKEREVVKIGDTVTLIGKPVKDYYDVTEWTADGIDIADGKFVMPARDVVLSAASSPKSYNISIIYDKTTGQGTTLSAKYMDTVTLPKPPVRDGFTYYWESDDVDICEVEGIYTFTMPHEDVSITCVYTAKTANVYYYIDGEAEPYYTYPDVPEGKEMFAFIDLPVKEGYTFSENWVCLEALLVNDEGEFTMPDRDVYFWGRYTKEDENMIMLAITVEVDGIEKNHYTFWANKGESFTLPDIKLTGYTLTYESSDAVVDGKTVAVPTGEDVYEVSLTASFTK